MAGGYDLILKGGTVVNQDGEGVRDLENEIEAACHRALTTCTYSNPHP